MPADGLISAPCIYFSRLQYRETLTRPAGLPDAASGGCKLSMIRGLLDQEVVLLGEVEEQSSFLWGCAGVGQWVPLPEYNAGVFSPPLRYESADQHFFSNMGIRKILLAFICILMMIHLRLFIDTDHDISTQNAKNE